MKAQMNKHETSTSQHVTRTVILKYKKKIFNSKQRSDLAASQSTCSPTHQNHTLYVNTSLKVHTSLSLSERKLFATVVNVIFVFFCCWCRFSSPLDAQYVMYGLMYIAIRQRFFQSFSSLLKFAHFIQFRKGYDAK